MKINICILALAACLVFTACNTKKGGSSDRVKTETSGRGSVMSYFYNPDKSLSYTVNNTGVKTSYKTEGNIIRENIVDSMRGQNITSTLYLNAKGYVDSSTATAQGSVYSNVYTHNADGYMTGAIEKMNGNVVSHTTFTYKDGNQTVVSVLDTAGAPQVNVYFDYYTDKPYSLRNENYGRTFYGVDSKNAIKSVVQVRPAGDTLRAFNFKYNYDDKGRVIAKIVSDKTGMLLDSSNVTYY